LIKISDLNQFFYQKNHLIKIANLIKILIVNFHYDLIKPNNGCAV